MRPIFLGPTLVCTMLLLAGCGAGSSGDDPPTGGPAPMPMRPAAFSASVAFDPIAQRFNATWSASSGADRYRVLLKRTSAEGFETLSDSVSSSTPAFDFVAGLSVEWMAAGLRVEACNPAGCTAAPDIALLPYEAAAVAQKNYEKSALARNEEFFGFSVATSSNGNTLAVGLPKSDADALTTDTGSVQIFVQAGATWSLQTTLTSPSIHTGDQFGFALALSGDGSTLAVAAPYESNDNAPRAGAVYVFTRDATGNWDRQAAHLRASNAEGAAAGEPEDGDQLGFSLGLSIDGKTIVAGAWNEDGDDNAARDSGAAYIFTRTGANSWAQQAYLKASNAEAGDQFGAAASISSDGNLVAIGAFHEDGSPMDDGSAHGDHNGLEESGAAYVFARNGTQWSQQAYVKAPHAASLDWFGWNLALAPRGDLLAVGAPFETRRDGITGGVVHLYSRSSSGNWTLQSDIEAAQGFPGSIFGSALEFAGDGKTLAISAPNANVTQGQVYLFLRVGDEWRQQNVFAAANPDVGDQYGVSLALSADAQRLFVGAAGEAGDANSTAANPNNGAPSAGAVYVY
jgi:hypothetical protein